MLIFTLTQTPTFDTGISTTNQNMFFVLLVLMQGLFEKYPAILNMLRIIFIVLTQFDNQSKRTLMHMHEQKFFYVVFQSAVTCC